MHVLEMSVSRPKTRGECLGGVRPCPWVGCRYHLALDEHNGTMSSPLTEQRLLFGDSNMAAKNWADTLVEGLDSMGDTCALDVADRGAATLQDMGSNVYLTRERIRQIEQVALRKLRKASDILRRRFDYGK